MIFTSPRIYWATALDYPALNWMAGTAMGRGLWRAMLLQAIVTLALIATFGSRQDGFTNIVASTAPYFWMFLALTIISLIVCRFRFKDKFQGYRIPLGPTLPTVFVAACLFMIFRAWDYMIFKNLWLPTFLIGVWVVVGVVLSFAIKSETTEQNE
jgi:APA family basic amino acid/polyamine antiporter